MFVRDNGWEAEVMMGEEKTGEAQKALGHCHHERSEGVSRTVREIASLRYS